MQRRDLLQTALAAAGGLMTTGSALSATDVTPGNTRVRAPIPWKMMYDLVVRIPEGKLAEWDRVWRTDDVPLLEEKGQWLWGAWSSLTGRQSTITHQWAYRDMTHFQAMNEMRGSDPQVRAMTQRMGVKIEETLISSVMTPLPYHPAAAPEVSEQETGIIATHRIAYQFYNNGGGVPQHTRAATEYMALATKHGAQLVGAYQTYFGWAPSYILQVWRYPSINRYWDVRSAIEADPEGQRLLTEMRGIFPNETVELHRPLTYSRVR